MAFSALCVTHLQALEDFGRAGDGARDAQQRLAEAASEATAAGAAQLATCLDVQGTSRKCPMGSAGTRLCSSAERFGLRSRTGVHICAKRSRVRGSAGGRPPARCRHRLWIARSSLLWRWVAARLGFPAGSWRRRATASRAPEVPPIRILSLACKSACSWPHGTRGFSVFGIAFGADSGARAAFEELRPARGSSR